MSTRTTLLCAAYVAAFCVSGNAQITRVVNSASLIDGPVAPGSIVTIFGTNLARGVALVSDPANPPATLGGVSITVGGAPAGLFYTSPTQINAVVASGTPTGTDQLVLTSSAGTLNATVTVDKSAAPGLFSLSGNGVGDGAILNSFTYQKGAFSTTTNGSITYLSLFGTGIDTSSAVTAAIAGMPATVSFAGNAPCCAGLQQVNIQVPPSLAGAGRVPLTITAGGKTSNVVEVVLLPNQGQGPFANDHENQKRNREIAAIAYVPNSSFALVTDENDDVVRVIDVSQRKVVKTIALAQGAEPFSVAVDAAGKTAVVTERNAGNLAIIDVATWAVLAEVPVGNSPAGVAITSAGKAVVALEGSNTKAAIVDLTSHAVATVTVGNNPRGVATNATLAYVTNENSASVSVVDTGAGTLTNTFNLPASSHPMSIQVSSMLNFAAVTNPAAGPDGSVFLIDLTSGKSFPVAVNPERSGGATDVAVWGNTFFFANQTGGSVSIVPVTASSSGPQFTVSTVKVDLGPRALAVDTKDNFLLVTNEGSGTVVLIDLKLNRVAGRIDAVRSETEAPDSPDDHSDHDGAANAPAISSLSPNSAKAGTTFTLTVSGQNLTGAKGLVFVTVNGHGKGNDAADDDGGHGQSGDPSFTVTNLQVASGGNQITATVAIASGAAAGPRVVRVTTANGESTPAASAANTFTVTQ